MPKKKCFLKKGINILLLLFICSVTVTAQTRALDSLQAIIAQQKKDTVYFEALTRLGIEYELINSKQAIYYFRKNIEESGKNQNKSTGVAALRLVAVYSASGINDSTEYYLALASEVVEKHPDNIKLKADYHRTYGVHLNRIGNRWEALAQYNEISKLDTSIINKADIAGNYLNISNVYGGLDMTEERIDATFKSLAIFEEIQNQLGISFCYNTLGIIYYNQKDYIKAEEWYLKSLALREQLDNKPAIAVALNNLGNVAMDTERYDEALNYFQRSMEINKSMSTHLNTAHNHINTGKVYQKKGESDKALFHFTEAKNIIETLPGTPDILFVLAEIGRIYSEMGQKHRAEATLNEALETAMQRNSMADMRRVYSFLKDHYESTGQYKRAFESQRLYFQIKDSLESQELKFKINNLESKYEFGKKEAEVELLKAERERDQLLLEKQRGRQFVIFLILIFAILTGGLLINRYRVLNRTRRQLELEKMRSVIARDLHDDLGSALSSINIISQVALNEKNGEGENYYQRINEQSSRMMESMSDIVWSINPNNDSLEQVLVKMKEFTAEILEPKDIAYHFREDDAISGIRLDVDKRKNLFLVFKEIINNAAKYSESKNVTIILLATATSLTLSVNDDGKGFDPAEVKPGNGLRNMADRAKAMNAIIHRESSPGKGTQIRLEIPLV
ncbi:MAG: tetratricopeptide repeat protein [Cyclobacteriaceae bacterium]|nr:tetratricopeptide repeat protein [Cyclobacteriaceae bacterium]